MENTTYGPLADLNPDAHQRSAVPPPALPAVRSDRAPGETARPRDRDVATSASFTRGPRGAEHVLATLTDAASTEPAPARQAMELLAADESGGTVSAPELPAASNATTVDRTDELCDSSMVHLLLSRVGEADGARDGRDDRPRSIEAAELDGMVDPAELFVPSPADFSQLAAVVALGDGCHLVLDGPRGVGKFQTIAN